MWVKELYIKNWMIIKEANLAFTKELSIVGIVGRYAEGEDSGRSNRAGKTTVIEAIRYLLFGRGRVTSGARLVNRAARDQGEGFVLKGTFILSNGSELTVTRIRDDKGKGTVCIEGMGEVGWEAANSYIEELIGFTNEEFGNTCHFEQGNIHRFMEASPADKRELLLHWLNQDRWERRRVYVAELSAVEARRLETIRASYQALGEVSKDISKLEASRRDLEKKVARLRSVCSMRRQKVDRLRNELAKAEKRESDERTLVSLRDTVKHCNEDIRRIASSISKARDIRAEIDKLQGEQEKAREATSGYTVKVSLELGRLDSLLDDKARRLEMVGGSGGVCPIIGEGCDRLGAEASDELATEIDGLRSQVKTIEADKRKRLKELKGAEAAIATSIKSCRAVLDSLGNLDQTTPKRMKERSESEIARIEKELEGVSVRGLDEIDADLAPAIEDLYGFEAQLERAVGSLGSVETELANAVRVAEKRRKVKDEMLSCSKEASALSYCSFMFSNRGIPGEYIKASFQSLETDINYLLRRMGTTLSVEFKPYREGKDYEASCLVCGNAFKAREEECEVCGEPRPRKRIDQLVLNITDHSEGGAESDFSMDSGGGQVLISFAVRLALLMLKIRSGNCEVPPIILDEVVGFLDVVNRRAVIDVVVNILTNEFGVEQVWWISHNEEILDMLESSLVVKRYGDHSVVDWM